MKNLSQILFSNSALNLKGENEVICNSLTVTKSNCSIDLESKSFLQFLKQNLTKHLKDFEKELKQKVNISTNIAQVVWANVNFWKEAKKGCFKDLKLYTRTYLRHAHDNLEV